MPTQIKSAHITLYDYLGSPDYCDDIIKINDKIQKFILTTTES